MEKTFTISFNYQGATGGEKTELTRTVNENTAIDRLPVPERIGYTFGGWYTKKNGGGTEYTRHTPVIINTELYAKWIANRVPDAASLFGDIAEKKWYNEAVGFAVENGLFSGTGPGVFEPNTKMTRAMFVTVMGRLAEQMGEKTGGYTSSFSDVQSGAWYEKYVSWASAKKLVNGYSPTTFGTSDYVSREDMAVLLIRFTDYMGIQLPEKSTKYFNDSALISGYAKESVANASQAGIVSGDSSGTFRPKDTSTRAEVAQVFYNFLAVD